MNLHRLACLPLLALALLAAPVRADDLTPQKRADIEQLLVTTGSMALGRQMAQSVIASSIQELRRARPDIPPQVLDLLPGEVMATFDENVGALQGEMVLLYHKYFTGPEIQELLRFYSTDVGRKTIQVLPPLMQEAFAAGQRWGQSLTPRIRERIIERLRANGVRI